MEEEEEGRWRGKGGWLEEAKRWLEVKAILSRDPSLATNCRWNLVISSAGERQEGGEEAESVEQAEGGEEAGKGGREGRDGRE